MRVLQFNAKVGVYLEDSSSTTVEDLAQQVAGEFYLNLNLPQNTGEVDFAIHDVSVTFLSEDAPISDAEYHNIPDEDEDESQAWEGEGI